MKFVVKFVDLVFLFVDVRRSLWKFVVKFVDLVFLFVDVRGSC